MNLQPWHTWELYVICTFLVFWMIFQIHFHNGVPRILMLTLKNIGSGSTNRSRNCFHCIKKCNCKHGTFGEFYVICTFLVILMIFAIHFHNGVPRLLMFTFNTVGSGSRKNQHGRKRKPLALNLKMLLDIFILTRTMTHFQAHSVIWHADIIQNQTQTQCTAPLLSPGAVACPCSPSIWEAETGGSFEFRGSGLQCAMTSGWPPTAQM